MKTLKQLIVTSLIAITLLSACGGQTATRDWTLFKIQEQPEFDIQFRLPPDWYVDYAPQAEDPTQWDVALVPPKCAEDQESEFEDNCISLTAYLKNGTSFSKDNFIALVSRGISLNQSQTEESVLISQETFEVNGIEMERFTHRIMIGEEAVQLMIIFFETDGAYYTFFSEFPYDERTGGPAENFDLLINSIEPVE